jgi:hypothetical protein
MPKKGMLSKFYESLYLKVFVNIVVGKSKLTIYIESLNKKGVVHSNEEVFENTYLSAEAYEFILSYTKESPFFYISVLDSSTTQGAIPTCDKNKADEFHDLISSEYKCYDNNWIYYTEKSDIFDIEKNFEKIGVDYIFSPFVVLAHFFKDKINSHIAMFILVEENSLSLSIFENSKLLYAQYIDINNNIENDEILIDESIDDSDDIELDDDEGINLDDIDAIDDIDELDDFGDIADLDAIEEIEEFSEAKDIEEELEQENITILDDNQSESFNEDYQRFSLMQSAVNSFYKSKQYNSDFVETVYIADSVGVSSDLKRYLEEEMFLNVYIRHIDLAMELCEVAKLEEK